MFDDELDDDICHRRRPARELILLELYRSVERCNHYAVGRDSRFEDERIRQMKLRELFERMPYE